MMTGWMQYVCFGEIVPSCHHYWMAVLAKLVLGHIHTIYIRLHVLQITNLEGNLEKASRTGYRKVSEFLKILSGCHKSTYKIIKCKFPSMKNLPNFLIEALIGYRAACACMQMYQVFVIRLVTNLSTMQLLWSERHWELSTFSNASHRFDELKKPSVVSSYLDDGSIVVAGIWSSKQESLRSCSSVFSYVALYSANGNFNNITEGKFSRSESCVQTRNSFEHKN